MQYTKTADFPYDFHFAGQFRTMRRLFSDLHAHIE